MKKTIITIISLLVVLSVLAYGYEFVFKKPIIESPTVEQTENKNPQIIEVKEQYKNQTYTFVGTVQVPTPCHTLVSKVNTLSSTSYQIEITTIQPVSDIVCAQVITDKTYKVSFNAPEDITVTALIDGVMYDLNRFIVPQGQNIDTFKLEIKG